jgi:hypothetical protein
MLARLVRHLAIRQPTALVHFLKAFYECARSNPRVLQYVGITSALYLHVGPFSRHVMSMVDRQIAEIDAGKWQPGPLAERVPAKVVSPPGHPVPRRARVGRVPVEPAA